VEREAQEGAWTMSMHASERISERGAGGALFASILMMVGGAMSALQGIAGITKSTFFVVPADYWITINTTAWGWIHLGVGVILVAAGLGILTAATWARWLGIAVVAVSAVVSFAFIPVQPFTSLALLAIDVWIIHSLAVHKREEMIYLDPGAVTGLRSTQSVGTM
jgi:hypothetical protein